MAAYVPSSMIGDRTAAFNGLNAYSQSKRGRGLSQDEFNQFGFGDAVNGDQYNAGIDWLDNYREPAQQPAAQPTSGTSAPTSGSAANPWAQYGMDPTKNQAPTQTGTKEQAIAGLRYLAGVEGIPVGESELNAAANAAGYSGDGPVTGEQYNKAAAYLRSIKSGNTATASGSTSTASAVKVAAPGAYKPSCPAPSALPPYLQVARPSFAQYQAPSEGFTSAEDALINNILANPGTLGPDVVNQMKARAKENAVAQSQQLRGEATRDLAGRGFSAGGGTSQAVQAAYDQQLIDSLINSNRELDINAATTNRQNLLDALAAAESVQGGRVSRASTNFQNTLAGQSAQADSDFRRDQLGENQRQFDSQYGLQRYQAEEGNNLVAADSALRNADFEYGQMKDDRSMALQELLGKGGLDLDRQKLEEQAKEFKAATGLDLMKLIEDTRRFDTTFGENQRQFNNNLAYNYTGLNLNQQNGLLNYLLSAFGGG